MASADLQFKKKAEHKSLRFSYEKLDGNSNFKTEFLSVWRVSSVRLATMIGKSVIITYIVNSNLLLKKE